MRKSIALLVCALFFGLVSYGQNLSIGTLTSVKSDGKVIYLAGSEGIASINADQSVNWETKLPSASIRLIHLDNDGIAFSSYTIEGVNQNLLSAFSSLWNKLVVSKSNAGFINTQGKLVWSKEIHAKNRLSEPAVKGDLMAMNSADTLYILKKLTGEKVASTYNTRKQAAIGGMKSQITPTRPLITDDAIYSTNGFLLIKTDLKGNKIKDEWNFGMQKDLSIMSVSPVFMNNTLIFGNCAVGAAGTKMGCSRIYAATADLKEDWNEFVDKNGFSGITELASNNDMVLVATSWNLYAFNAKGKSLWEYDKLGKPANRGASCSGNICIKTVDGNFLSIDNTAAYISGYKKNKKAKTESENVTVIDLKSGKFIKEIELTGKIWDMALTESKIVVLTTEGLKMLDK
jgi:hypothetical protein